MRREWSVIEHCFLLYYYSTYVISLWSTPPQTSFIVSLFSTVYFYLYYLINLSKFKTKFSKPLPATNPIFSVHQTIVPNYHCWCKRVTGIFYSSIKSLLSSRYWLYQVISPFFLHSYLCIIPTILVYFSVVRIKYSKSGHLQVYKGYWCYSRSRVQATNTGMSEWQQLVTLHPKSGMPVHSSLPPLYC